MRSHQTISCAFAPERFHSHEIVMLSEGTCPLFFPTVFIREDARVVAVYDCSRYAPLGSFRIEKTEDALFLLEKVLLLLHRSMEYLIMPERILLSPETVFYAEDTGSVRIAFVPVPDPGCSLQQNILRFLGALAADLCDIDQHCLNQLAQKIRLDSMNLRDMLTLTGLIRRRIDSKSNDFL
ncbi:MAG: DUF6382 domain-containing protein [Bacillota bacterium]|nr:DUF6382 domain-containing protein [Bacillota bacterium]